MTDPDVPHIRARFVVCEDGDEYLERFERFLGTDYEFVQSRCLRDLLQQLTYPSIAGVLLDLDFRRTDLSLLVDGDGKPLANANQEERKRLTRNQGLAILACVRQVYTRTPVLLFADLPETQQTFLFQHFAPLHVVPSHVSMRELNVELEVLARRSSEI